jgi:hypothetical protein
MHRFLFILAAGVLAGGCTAAGDGSNGPSGAPGTNSPSPVPAHAYDHSPTALLLRIDSGGGLVPIDFFLDHMPRFSLYGDGMIVVPGAVDASYPSPLLKNLRAVQATPAEVERILAAADTAGLLGPDASYMVEGIMDAPTTTFTAIVAGRKHVVSAYALGIDGPGGADPAVTAARARLLEFGAMLADLPKFLGRDISAADAYAPTSMRVFTAPYDSAADTGSITRQELAWPLTVDPGSGGEPARAGALYRCLALTDSDLAIFATAAAKANGLTIWKAASGRYTTLVRPNLPDESGCGSAGA